MVLDFEGPTPAVLPRLTTEPCFFAGYLVPCLAVRFSLLMLNIWALIVSLIKAMHGETRKSLSHR